MKKASSFPYLKYSLLVAFLLTVAALLVIIPARSASQTQFVLIYTVDSAGLPADLHILERYDAFVLAEVPVANLKTLQGQFPVDTLSQRTIVSINGIVFDTAAGEPTIPTGLQAAADDPYFLIQFYGPIKSEWLTDLEAMGVTFLGYHPNFTFIVRMDPALLAKIREAHAVQWVGQYQPAYRLASEAEMKLAMNSDGRLAINVSAFPGEDSAAFQQNLQGAGVSIEFLSPRDPPMARVWATSEQLAALAALPGVYRVEPYVTPEFDNERAAQVIHNWDVREATRNGLLQDLMGEGQIAGMVDSGLDANTTTPRINDFYDFTNGIQNSRIVASLPGNGCSSLCNCYAQDDENSSGHGTHVAGSIIGNGYNALLQRGLQSQARGSNPYFDYAWGVGQAPEAKFVFAHTAGRYSYQDGTLCGLGDLYMTWQSVYLQGARSVNNSWGANRYSYGGDASVADQVMWNYQDYLIVTSARNDGPGFSTVGQPGTAKNIISVGASGNHISVFGQSSDTATLLTYFSSRGPVDVQGGDGRYKPDLVAPGADVLSTRTTYIPNTKVTLWSNEPGDGDGNGQLDYWWSGGTSMSAPQVTGAATIVRDYLQDIRGLGDSTPPSAALIKALLTNGAVDIGYGYEAAAAYPYGGRNMQGWGIVNVEQSITPRAPRSFFYDDFTNINGSQHASTLGFTASGQYKDYTFGVLDASEPLKITLTWTDQQFGADGFAVNNLDLLVIAPGGAQYWGNVFSGSWSVGGGAPDTKNNTEAVYLQNPATGTWTIRVIATTIGPSTQPYALVTSGGLGTAPSYTRTDTSGRSGTSAQPYFPSLKPIGGTQEHTSPGGSFTTSIRLTNWGTNTDIINLSMAATDLSGHSVGGISASFAPSGPFNLAPGAAQDVQITVKVANTVAVAPYDVTLTAISNGTGNRKDAQVIGLNVIHTPDLLNEKQVVPDIGPQFSLDFWGTGQTLWAVYLTADSHINSDAKIWTVRSTDGGQTWTKMGQVDFNDGRYLNTPVIAGNSSGTSVTVVWVTGDSTATYARTWTSVGGWGPIKTLATYTSGNVIADPEVIYDNNGDILAVWLAYRGAQTTSGVFSSYSTNDGSSWSNAAGVPFATSPGNTHRWPQLTLDTLRNNVWMAYAYKVLDANRDIFLKRWDGNTNTWDNIGTRNIAVAASNDREVHPAITYIPATDSLWVSWFRYTDYSNPTAQIYFARSSGSLPDPTFNTIYGPYATRIAEAYPAMMVGDGSYSYISYLAFNDLFRGANIYMMRIPAAGGPPNLTYQANATVDDPPLYAHGNAGSPHLEWLTTTINSMSLTGPTLLYTKNPPNNDNPNYGNSGVAQTLFNLSENFDIYLTQARSFPVPIAYADTDGLCGGHTPCYISFQAAINEVDNSGTVNVYPKTYNEDISLNKNITVNVLGDATINSLSISAGTFNAPNGKLTLTGNFTFSGGAFNPGNGALDFQGSSLQTIGGSQPATFNELEIDDNSGVALAQDEKVNEELDLERGLLTLGSNNLTLGAAASILGTPSASKMVVATGSGELRKVFTGSGSFTYPVGDASGIAHYSPVTLNFTSGAFSNAYAGIRLAGSAHPLNPTTIDYLTRYWAVTQSGISAFSCTATFNYLATDVVGTETNLLGKLYDGTWWTMLNPVDAVNHRFSATVTSFSDFTAGLNEPEIIRLSSFNVTSQALKNLVQWHTTLESTLTGFNVYRAESMGGARTKLNSSLITATGAGSDYSLEDANIVPGTTYYYWIEVIGTSNTQAFGPVVTLRLLVAYLPLIVQLP